MTFDKIKDELAQFDDMEDRYRALIELGRDLEPMPEALKTDATKVRGCSSQVWLHAQRRTDGHLHFSGDSDAHIVRGLVAVLMALIQDRPPAEVAAVDARARLAELGLAGHLSPTRSNGFAAMAQQVHGIAAQAMAHDERAA
jgi:cysteine desulfuration protein SufE